MKINNLFLLIFLFVMEIAHSQIIINNIQIEATPISADVTTLNSSNFYNRSEISKAKLSDTTCVNYWINIGGRSLNKDISAHSSFNFALQNLSFSVMFAGTGGIKSI